METGTFYFYVSQSYAEQGVLLSDIPYSALIRVNGATEMGLIDFENTVYRLALSQDISRNQLYFNSKFCSSLISGSGMGGVLLATLLLHFQAELSYTVCSTFRYQIKCRRLDSSKLLA